MASHPNFPMSAAFASRGVDILTVGSLVLEQIVKVDRWPSPGAQDNFRATSVASSAGGCAVNVACYGARLGARTSIVTAAGDGQYGQPVLKELDRSGVDRRHVRHFAGREGSLLIILSGSDGGWATLDYCDRSVRLSADALPNQDAFGDAKFVHIDGYSFVTIGDEVVVEEAYRRARSAGCLISVDSSVPAATTNARYLRALFTKADIVFANAFEAMTIAGTATLATTIDFFRNLGPSVAIIKRGAEGSIVVTQDFIEEVPAFPVNVIDTIAAGDAYIAATLAELCRGRPLMEAVVAGSAAGALACCGAGSLTSYFTSADVNNLVNQYPDRRLP